MAEKLITDLQLRDDVEADVNFPVDDGIQSYRVTGAQIAAYVKDFLSQQLLPSGMVAPFAGASGSTPSGWLFCNGQAVSRTTYAALFAVIGITHGQGDGSTTFNVPDYRGRFLRGVDGGTARDPDAATRTAMGTGGNTGDAPGSVQGHAFQTHTHVQNAHTHTQNAHNHLAGLPFQNGWGTAFYGMQAVGNGNNINPPVGGVVACSSHITSGTTATNQNTTATNQNAAATGTLAQASTSETRPVNAAVNYIIKI